MIQTASIIIKQQKTQNSQKKKHRPSDLEKKVKQNVLKLQNADIKSMVYMLQVKSILRLNQYLK